MKIVTGVSLRKMTQLVQSESFAQSAFRKAEFRFWLRER